MVITAMKIILIFVVGRIDLLFTCVEHRFAESGTIRKPEICLRMDSTWDESTRLSREDDDVHGARSRLPGAASLYEQLDKLILVCLRDGRNFRGWLRSFDQYANLVLDNTVERLMVEDSYADIPIGIFVIRGENVMLLGEIDADKDIQLEATKRQVSEAEIRRALVALKAEKQTFSRREKLEWPLMDDY